MNFLIVVVCVSLCWTTLLPGVASRCRLKGKLLTYDCIKSGLHEIPRSIPKTVKYIDLSNNNITRISYRQFYSQLTSLRIRTCSISVIEKNAFVGAVNLKMLDMSGNFLNRESFQMGCFKPLVNLQRLILDQNIFSVTRTYPAEEISRLTNLRNLTIDIFDGFNFSQEFQNLRELRMLRLKAKRALEIHNDSFSAFHGLNIQTVYIRASHQLDLEIDSLHAFQNITSLSVEAGFAEKSNILDALFPLQHKQMISLDLSAIGRRNSQLTALNVTDVRFLKNMCVSKVNLAKNQLSSVPLGLLANSKFGECLKTLEISHNHILSDIYDGGFMFFKKIQTLRACCMSPCTENRDHTRTGQSKAVTVFFPKSLEVVDISYNDLSMQNLKELTIKAKGIKNLNFAYTCSTICNKIMDGLPNIQYFNMSGWQCGSLHPSFLSNMKSLRSLDASNADLDKGLKRDVNGTFLVGLTELRNLSLSENQLKSLHSNFLKNVEKSLQHLVLRKNSFWRFPIVGGNYPNLDLIDIRNNKIVMLKKDEMDIVDGLAGKTKILISDNPLSCSCETFEFLKWLKENRGRFPDLGETTCTYNSALVNLSDFIPNVDDNLSKCSSRSLVIILALSISVALVAMVTTFLVICCKRTQIEYSLIKFGRYWKSRYVPLSASETLNYDMFVCFSAHDETWVEENIVNDLEQDNKHRLCLYERDFPIGVAITDCIIQAVEQSRYVAFVLSSSFFESEWGKFEMEIVRRCLEGITNLKVIVILKEQIPKKSIPKTMQQIMSKSVRIEWPDDPDETSRDTFRNELKKAIVPGESTMQIE